MVMMSGMTMAMPVSVVMTRMRVGRIVMVMVAVVVRCVIECCVSMRYGVVRFVGMCCVAVRRVMIMGRVGRVLMLTLMLMLVIDARYGFAMLILAHGREFRYSS